MKNNLLRKLNLKMYESNQVLGNFGPVPYGSVELSEQKRKLTEKSKNFLKICEEKAFLDYRFGKIHSSNLLYKSLISQPRILKENTKSSLIIGLAVTSTLQRDYAESNEIFSSVEKSTSLSVCERKAIKYWQCRNYLGLMSFKGLEEFYEKISRNEASWFLIELYLKNINLDPKFAARQIRRWNLTNDNSYTSLKCLFKLNLLKEKNLDLLFNSLGFPLDHHTMLAYLDKFGLEDFLNNWRLTVGTIPYTSELVAAISLFSIRNNGPQQYCDFYSANRIKYLGSIQIPKKEREKLVYDSITYHDGIRDFNTSNFGGRTYTLDLSESKIAGFKNLKRAVEQRAKDCKYELKSILTDQLRPATKNLRTWFDASFTSGGSNIYPHLHTGGSTKTYYFTAVYYAQVPSDMGEGQGDLIFSNTDITSKKYNKTPIKRQIKVNTGDLYIFPSYFFHSTTPSFTRNVRLTFNFDFFSDSTNLNI